MEASKTWQGRVVDGKFPLRQWLGGSDHSAVFMTETESANAAIKLVPVASLDANLQLLRWSQAAQLSHPHLLRLLTQGRSEFGGAPFLYLVMEYAEEDLSQILPHRALTAGETRDFLRPILDALSYLHGRDLVHGHIQPANVLAVGNQVKLSADQVRASADASGGVRHGNVYDPPESATQAPSPAGDVWSLGVTLVVALTQKVPAYQRVGQNDSGVPATLPEPFRSIARDCLRRDPKERCTIAEIKARLQTVPRPPVTLPPSPPPPSQAKPSRSLILFPAAALLLLAVVFGIAKLLTPHEAAPAGRESTPAASAPTASTPAAAPHSSATPVDKPKPPTSAGEVARQVLPDVPRSARNTIQGKIRVGVRVSVDSSGNVTEATLTSPGPSKYFAKQALKAAQRWEFTPPQVGNRNVPSVWLLRFQFGRNGTQVFPSQERR